MTKRYGIVGAIAVALAALAFLTPRPIDQGQLRPLESVLTEPRPIPTRPTVFLAEMTWMEVRDWLAAGNRRIIVPIGGIEQNGPYVSLEKHNLIVKRVAGDAARLLGDTLVAPTIPLSPEGEISPPSGHMIFQGTISLREETLIALLRDVVASLVQHGFAEVYLIADSGDAQAATAATARLFQGRTGATVAHLADFYDYASIQSWIEEAGFRESAGTFHDSLAFSAQIAAIDPHALRIEERRSVGIPTLNGVPFEPLEPIAQLGQTILTRRAELLAEKIRSMDRKHSIQ